MDNSHAILILAAGQSKRFKGIKQLAPFNHTTLLNHVIHQALSANCGQVYVVLGAHREKIRPTLDLAAPNIIENVDWEKGMGLSLAIGLEYILENIKMDSVMILLGDQAFVDAGVIASMVEKFHSIHKNIVATRYSHSKIGPPVLFSKSHFSDLLKLSDDTGAKKLIESHLDDVHFVDNEDIMMDIDTKDDYAKLIKAFEYGV